MRKWIGHLLTKARNRTFRINALQIIGLLMVLGVVVAVSGAWVYTDSPNFCARCHPNMVQHWRSSTHQTVKCIQCHVDPDMKGALGAKVHGLYNVWVSVTKGITLTEHEIPLPINSARCLSCHRAILRLNEVGYLDLPDNNLKSDGLAVGHRIHVEKHGIDCVWCHRGIVHRDPAIVGKYAFNMPLHQDCRACHNGQYLQAYDITLPDCDDPESCIQCHTTVEVGDVGE